MSLVGEGADSHDRISFVFVMNIIIDFVIKPQRSSVESNETRLFSYVVMFHAVWVCLLMEMLSSVHPNRQK